MSQNKLSHKVAQLALKVGGSHYPEVGGQLLQKFADSMLIEFDQILEQVKTKDNTSTINQIKQLLTEQFTQ
jgi:hypothetical protein